MLSVQVGHVPAAAATALAQRAQAHDGWDSLGEETLERLGRPPDDHLVEWSAGDPAEPAVLVVLRRLDTIEPAHWELRLVADPAHRDPALLATLLRAATASVDGPVVAWFPGAHTHTDDAAEAAGFEPQRVLHRMEGPLEQTEVPTPEGVHLRGIEPADAASWVALNNRAFAGHPEQGGWTPERFEEATGEEWYDPRGFLVAERDDALVGFCWTKQHDDGAGEIYVVGVDPDHHGSGLGRVLTVAGLANLRERGSTYGLLYVDAFNLAAVGLYESLGFTVTRSDAAWVKEAPR